MRRVARVVAGLATSAVLVALAGLGAGEALSSPATRTMAHAEPAPDAVVLESMYPTIEEAVVDRLTRRLGPVGSALAPLLLWQLPLRTGISPDQLRPVDAIASLKAPVLAAAGTRDEHTTLAESRRIFDAAREPKQFWAVDGAAHVDLFNAGPEAWRTTVIAFLDRYLVR